jgi:hypothetical protein
MTHRPVDLDEHRGMAAQKSTEIRRRLLEVQADQAALRFPQVEFERYAVAAPSATWVEAAAKAISDPTVCRHARRAGSPPQGTDRDGTRRSRAVVG